MNMYIFEKCLPQESNAAMWSLQNYLLEKAEGYFGSKDPEKTIFQPVFSGERLCIINRCTGDGAWAS